MLFFDIHSLSSFLTIQDIYSYVFKSYSFYANKKVINEILIPTRKSNVRPTCNILRSQMGTVSVREEQDGLHLGHRKRKEQD